MTISHDLQSIGFLTAFRESALMYPIIMTTHLTCIAVFGGMILATDLRLLGVAFKDYSIAEVVRGLRPWKHLGFTIMVFCGLLLATSEAEKYTPNPFFWIKMTILALIFIHGLVFRPLVYKNPEELDKSPVIPTRAKVAAILSLVLWMSMITFGRLIGYWEGPEAKNRAAEIMEGKPLKMDAAWSPRSDRPAHVPSNKSVPRG